MSEETISFEVNLASTSDAAEVSTLVTDAGGQVHEEADRGLLPLPILLVIFIPPGLALLAQVVNRIVHSWKDSGVLIDARGDGPPRILKEDGVPVGRVIILSRDGEQAQSLDLPEPDVSEYIAAALEALSGGASATEAAEKADSLTGGS